MTRKQVWRYTCGFCKKSNCSAASIGHHEKGCTLNPDRVCRMCAVAELKQYPIMELIATLKIQPPNEDGLKMEPNDMACPVCTLAAIRQSGIAEAENMFDKKTWSGWDFKAAVATFWAIINDARAVYERYA